MSRYYNRQGQPISGDERMRLENADPQYYRIAETYGSGFRISTVWLGLDHQHGQGPPMIFETMCFGGGLDQDAERWSTEAEALAGHAKWVELARVEADTFRALISESDVREAVETLIAARSAYRSVVEREGWDPDRDYSRIVAAIGGGQ